MNGDGVAPDAISAYAWFRAAANAGISVAQVNSELIWQSLNPEAQELALQKAQSLQQSLGE